MGAVALPTHPFSDTAGGMTRLWLRSNAPPPPRFPPALPATELQALYAPTEEERAFVAAPTRGPAQHLTLLKCHQHLGYLPALADVLTQIRTYLCQQLQLPPATYTLVETKATLARYRYLIRTSLALTPYPNGGPRVVMEAVA